MKRKDLIALLILIAIVFIPIFAHLDVIPIQIWDEGRFADQAMNILKGHNWLIMQYRGGPDMWLVKPPFMMWLQAITMKLLGYNELAIRLPAALAAMGTCLILFFLFLKKTSNPLPGILAAIILSTIPGYVIVHGIRTGEADALLTMFTTAYALCFFLYIEEENKKYLWATIIFLTCATLTKSIEALVFMPSLLVYTVWKRKMVRLLKTGTFYYGLVLFLVFVISFYLFREHYNPGYLARVQEDEVMGRYTKVIVTGGNGAEYLNIMMTQYFSYWFLLVPAGLLAGIYSKEKAIKEITIFAALVGGMYVLIMSTSQTKLYWYLLPAYPFFAILAGVFLYTVFRILSRLPYVNEVLSFNILPYVFLLLVLFTPYVSICNYVLSNISDINMGKEQKNMQLYMQGVLHRYDKNMDGTVFLEEEMSHDLEWYVLALQAQHRPFKEIAKDMLKGDEKVAAYLEDSRKFLEDKYNFSVLSSFNNVVLYKLHGKKTVADTAGAVK